MVRIAGEGRKYGLYLLLVTQRPDKLEQNALTQCDNLILLRLNGAADVERIAAAFSFVSPSLLAEAPSFAKGEALVAGGSWKADARPLRGPAVTRGRGRRADELGRTGDAHYTIGGVSAVLYARPPLKRSQFHISSKRRYQAMAEIGPVQMIALAFGPDADFEGRIIDELVKLEGERRSESSICCSCSRTRSPAS